MTANRRGRSASMTAPITAPLTTPSWSAEPAASAASFDRPSPYLRAATAVRPTLTISPSEITNHTQKIDVVTAAIPAEPMRVPTQNASTDANTVINNVDATAGSAVLSTVR